MKYNTLRDFLSAWLLSLAAAVGTGLCVQSAFALPLGHPALLFGLWTAAAAAAAFARIRRRGIGFLFWLMLLGLMGAAQLPLVRRQTSACVNTLLELYFRAYEWKLPPLPGSHHANTFDAPVGLIGLAALWLVGRAVFRRRNSPGAFAALVVPLWLCLIVTDTVPNPLPLALVLAVSALLLLTGNVRRESTAQAGRLLRTAVLPVILSLLLLFSLNPAKDYVNHSENIRNRVLSLWERLADGLPTEALGTLPDSIGREVNLAALNGQQKLGIPMLEVTGTKGGTVYLRQQSYEIYTGTGWEMGEAHSESFCGGGQPTDRLTLRTFVPWPMLLIPYYPPSGSPLVGGCLPNEAGLTEYTLERHSPAVLPFPGETLLSLPEETEAEARKILRRLGPLASTEAAATAVADYVRSSARYDLSTPAMPADGDFALWFLNESDSGFCVHFATAAAVLLRSAGVPARYVTGYRVSTVAGEPVIVTSDHAHAWVEYYNCSAQTWYVLEATPGAETSAPFAPPQTIPPDVRPVLSTVPQPSAPPQARRNPLLWLSGGWLAVGLLGMILILRRQLCLHLRRHRQHHGTHNAQAIARWEEAQQLARLLGEPVPEALTVLANQAAYSRHPLSAEELEAFSDYRRHCLQRLREKSPIRDFLYRYIYSAY